MSPAGVTPGDRTGPRARPVALPRPVGGPSTTGARSPMPKTYPDLLREARAEIREVTPAEADALRQRGGVRASTSARRPSGSRATSPARPTSARATSSSRSRPPSPIATRPSSCTAPAASGRCSRAQTLAGDGLQRRGLDDRRLPALEEPGPAVDAARVLTDGAEAALQPPPADPRGRARRPGEAARVEGAADRRRRAGAPAALYLAAAGVGHHRHRRLRRRRPVQPPAPDHPHQRPGRREEGRVGAQDDQRRSTPTSRSSPTRRCWSPTTSTGSSRATT